MKGRQTRAAILDAALKLASHMGLEGLSIGALAEVTEMSKSGVFAHFGSREELQISVVREYHNRFEEEVFAPALREPRGLPRLRALFERWVRRVSVEIDSGCIYISGAVEFDDRPGPVRDALVTMVQTWQQALGRAIRAAIAEGPPECRHRSRADPVRAARPGPCAPPRRALPAQPGRGDARARRLRAAGRALGAVSCTEAAAARRAQAPHRLPILVLGLSRTPEIPPMAHYTPPLRDMQFVLHEVLNVVDELKPLPAHAEIDVDTINAVLEEAGKFASQVLAPLNLSGDIEGCTLDPATHAVTAPKGFKEAYAQYVEAGWPALSSDPQYGGQGLPHIVNQCFFEMLNSANQAWTMYPGLSHGAFEALREHGSDEQKATYLPKLTSGEWTGTMCLTEPQCGTDLGLLRTKAIPNEKGRPTAPTS